MPSLTTRCPVNRNSARAPRGWISGFTLTRQISLDMPRHFTVYFLKDEEAIQNECDDYADNRTSC